ncbi:2-C-methyl-D-erythritol 4-phosphate cytidylyltransferase [Amphibacillus sediminis]|uniref:2-C-methyl-D-erythritol 4-phosphate cytidylyltransferase n=1 Tax=Amphibacillus sediminis TaxID=360185 RepID=UPI00083339F0|nr:2-C-methyl-D-erythritol 4-phosphate cytidylyltransferase [Amphibacillus sediminis]
MNRYNVIVLAAGQGKRMQTDQNKQFLLIDDKPIIIHTLNIYERDPNCTSIILVIRAEEKVKIKNLLQQYSWSTPIELICGGPERQDSVYCGLQAINNQQQLVFIHDGARPFVKQAKLNELGEAAMRVGAAILAVPVKDTIKQSINDELKTLDRTQLYAAQTPQAFHYTLISKAHEIAKRDHYYGTDDASLIERLGQRVELINGHDLNIKITTPEDLEFAQFIMGQWKKTKEG